ARAGSVLAVERAERAIHALVALGKPPIIVAAQSETPSAAPLRTRLVLPVRHGSRSPGFPAAAAAPSRSPGCRHRRRTSWAWERSASRPCPPRREGGAAPLRRTCRRHDAASAAIRRNPLPPARRARHPRGRTGCDPGG